MKKFLLSLLIILALSCKKEEIKNVEGIYQQNGLKSEYITGGEKYTVISWEKKLPDGSTQIVLYKRFGETNNNIVYFIANAEAVRYLNNEPVFIKIMN